MKLAQREARKGGRTSRISRTSRIREVSASGEHHSVEDLNPRGRLVKDVEMSIRSAQAMVDLVNMMQKVHHGDADENRNSDPRFWVGSIRKETTGMSKLMTEAEAGNWRCLPWSAWVDLALSGRLARQIEDLAGSLPQSVRKKYIGD